MIFLLLLTSVFNFPIYAVGDDAIGVFDLVFLTFLAFILLNYRKIGYTNFTIFFLVFFCFLLVPTLVNVENFELSSILYLAKILQFSILSAAVYTYVASDGDFSIAEHSRHVFFTLLALVAWCMYEFFYLGVFRTGLPFAYGSSGPLGLVTAAFLYFTVVTRSSIFYALAAGLLFFFSLSKSFVLSVFAIALTKSYFAVKLLKYSVLALFLLVVLYGFLEDLALRVVSLIDVILNLGDSKSMVYRLQRHWFVYWEEFHASGYVLFGGGINFVNISVDSFYFYILYSLGYFGSFCLLVALLLLSASCRHFAVYAIILLTSGIFLETALISYRGIEPLIIIFSILIAWSKRLKHV